MDSGVGIAHCRAAQYPLYRVLQLKHHVYNQQNVGRVSQGHLSMTAWCLPDVLIKKFTSSPLLLHIGLTIGLRWCVVGADIYGYYYSVICRVTYFQFPIQSAFLPCLKPGSFSGKAKFCCCLWLLQVFIAAMDSTDRKNFSNQQL